MVQTEWIGNAKIGQASRSAPGIVDGGPLSPAGSVMLYADILKHPELLSGAGHERSAGINQMYLNNVSAHPSDEDYGTMAERMAATMPQGATIEVQWTDSPETPGGEVGSRGHVNGLRLARQLAESGRQVSFSVSNDPNDIVGRDFTINQGKGPATSASEMSKYTPPAPDKRATITFVDGPKPRTSDDGANE